MSGVAQVRKAIIATVAAGVGSLYSALATVDFDFGNLSGAQWGIIVSTALAAWIAVYAVPNAPAEVDPSDTPSDESDTVNYYNDFDPSVDRFQDRESAL